MVKCTSVTICSSVQYLLDVCKQDSTFPTQPLLRATCWILTLHYLLIEDSLGRVGFFLLPHLDLSCSNYASTMTMTTNIIGIVQPIQLENERRQMYLIFKFKWVYIYLVFETKSGMACQVHAF